MKTKAHIRYRLKDGTIVPGVTTPLNLLAKPALIPWANKLGLQGVDVTKYVDERAEIGTLAHYLILCHLKGETPDTSDYSSNQISQAENSLISYFEWEKSHKIEPILIEEPLVSEFHKYGGTVDLYCKMNGELWLVDFKTGKGIFDEMSYQLAAYRELLKINGYQVDNCRILNIPRAETESFEEKVWTDLQTEFVLFLHCLAIYNLKKEIGK